MEKQRLRRRPQHPRPRKRQRSTRPADPISRRIAQPGGSAALRCLATNSVKLSPGCRTAVAAVGAIGGGAAGTSIAPSAATPAAVAPPVAPLTPRPFIMPERRLSILRICRTDVATLCGGTPPGGGRFIDCLGAHAAQLSPACYDAVARVSR